MLSGDRTSHLNMVRTSVSTQCKAHSQPLQMLYSKPAHRDISSSLVNNKYQLYYTRPDSSVVRASPRIGKVLGSNPSLVILFHCVTSGNSNTTGAVLYEITIHHILPNNNKSCWDSLYVHQIPFPHIHHHRPIRLQLSILWNSSRWPTP